MCPRVSERGLMISLRTAGAKCSVGDPVSSPRGESSLPGAIAAMRPCAPAVSPNRLAFEAESRLAAWRSRTGAGLLWPYFPDLGVYLPCLRDVGISRPDVTLLFFENATTVKGYGKMGCEPDRLAIILNCVVVVIFGLIGSATNIEGCGVLGIENDRLIQILDCVGIIAFLVIGSAALDKARSLIRIERNRLVIILNRTVVSAFVEIGVTAKQVGV
jgi:hypothetical protein